MQKVAAVKVDSFDYNYEDVEKGVNEALQFSNCTQLELIRQIKIFSVKKKYLQLNIEFVK